MVRLEKEIPYLPQGHTREKPANSGQIKELAIRCMYDAAIMTAFSISSTQSAELVYLQGHRDNTSTLAI